MAYCRWSSMNWRCDIYCYQHVDGGYTTHVASNRVLGDIPAEPSWDLIQTNQEQWVIEHKAVMDFLETCKRERIGLLHDGETFNDPDLEDVSGTAHGSAGGRLRLSRLRAARDRRRNEGGQRWNRT